MGLVTYVLTRIPHHTLTSHTHTHTSPTHTLIGDEILDIHGTTVTGMQVSEVVEVIKRVPNQFIATVRPLTSISKNRHVDTGSVLYSEIRIVNAVPVATRPPLRIPEILVSEETTTASPNFDASPTPSLEDVGYYDDEEDGDTPPPLPPRTEDALIILDPPPQPGSGGECVCVCVCVCVIPPPPISHRSQASPTSQTTRLRLPTPHTLTSLPPSHAQVKIGRNNRRKT